MGEGVRGVTGGERSSEPQKQKHKTILECDRRGSFFSEFGGTLYVLRALSAGSNKFLVVIREYYRDLY